MSNMNLHLLGGSDKPKFADYDSWMMLGSGLPRSNPFVFKKIYGNSFGLEMISAAFDWKDPNFESRSRNQQAMLSDFFPP